MDRAWVLLQLITIALLGASYVALAIWDERQPLDTYREWKSR